MNLNKCLLTKNDCYRAGRTITPQGVMVHSTGANNPMLKRYVQPDDGKLGDNKNNNSWNRGGTTACVHAFIGKLQDGTVATYQTLPWHWRGWHSGTGTSGKKANDTHISFEICEDGLTDKDYFNKVYREAVELTAHLCKLYALDPLKDGVVICHSEGYKRGVASNHDDVMHWFKKHGKDMDDFRADVKKAMGGEAKEEEKAVKLEVAHHFSSTYNKSFAVKSKDGYLNLRVGAGASKTLITKMGNGTKFRCYGYYNKAADGSIWLYGVANGKTGYCHRSYLY